MSEEAGYDGATWRRRPMAWIAVIWMLTAVPEAIAARAVDEAMGAVAVRHRIHLPDGSQIMLRREYRVIFRTPMRWSEGMRLERVYVADTKASKNASRAT